MDTSAAPKKVVAILLQMKLWATGSEPFDLQCLVKLLDILKGSDPVDRNCGTDVIRSEFVIWGSKAWAAPQNSFPNHERTGCVTIG